jgi:hypothetical protein
VCIFFSYCWWQIIGRLYLLFASRIYRNIPVLILSFAAILAIITALGDVAQLGERGVRNAVSVLL